MKQLITALVVTLGLCTAAAAFAPPESPSINPPYIFGVRPGSPFLFRLPVSGARPMEIKAAGLPEGLQLDAKSGIITGTISSKKNATYKVSITATNAVGSAQHLFRIVVGERICLTPPMGWNSWYVWADTVSEKHIRAAADAFEKYHLGDYGWSYINIDDCWQGLRDPQTKAMQPNENFPNIKGMVDYIHSKGYKAGIYTTPWMGSYMGFPGGTTDNPDGIYHGLPAKKLVPPNHPTQVFGWYPSFQEVFKADRVEQHWFLDRDAKQMADWGFDLVKLDWHPTDVPTARRVSKDFRAQQRDIVISLSNVALIEDSDEYAKLAEYWRFTGDIKDDWDIMTHNGFKSLLWKHTIGPGHWADPDMLQIGYTNDANNRAKESHPSRLTVDEQRFQFTLWCLLSSPLIVSCDFEKINDQILEFMTNTEAIAVNQDPLGAPAEEFACYISTLRVLRKKLEDGSLAIGLLNTGNTTIKGPFVIERLGLPAHTPLRDLWSHQALTPKAGNLTLSIPPHGAMLIRTMANHTRN